jgi:predicted membrane chloride channel (bestrophin family)
MEISTITNITLILVGYLFLVAINALTNMNVHKNKVVEVTPINLAGIFIPIYHVYFLFAKFTKYYKHIWI